MTCTEGYFTRLISLSIILLASFLILVPIKTFAYFTTHQEETVIDAHTALFQIDYVFGMKKHDVLMPILARNSTEVSSSAVSYSIVDEAGAEAQGATAGIVFGSTDVTKDGMYLVGKGHAKKFSLAVLFTPESYDPVKKYRLQVTYLPFNFDGKQQLQLNPSELTYYTTKLITL